MHRSSVPETDRPEWSRRLKALYADLRSGGVGHQVAVRAHHTLILVEIARLADEVVEGLYVRNDPVLAKVFAYIDGHYAERVSLKEVAAAINLSPGYLTAVIMERTRRGAQERVHERQVQEAELEAKNRPYSYVDALVGGESDLQYRAAQGGPAGGGAG